MSRLNFARVARAAAFCAGAFGKRLGIELRECRAKSALAQPEEFSSRMVTENFDAGLFMTARKGRWYWRAPNALSRWKKFPPRFVWLFSAICANLW